MVTRSKRTGAVYLAAMLVLSGCGGWPLHPAGPQAARIAEEWWLFFWTTAAVYLLVILALIVALARRSTATGIAETQFPPAVARRLTAAVGSAVAASVVVLIGLLVHDFFTGRAMEAFGASNPLMINITGHQWWWEIEYVDSVASNRITTANEIHIPVGRPVELSLTSGDVIHSFWVPELHGKRDLIPTYGRRLRLQADRPGVYRGQCAEFCGYQHAKMSLIVVAETTEAFAKWQKAQRQPSRVPQTLDEKRGHDVFMSHSCILCHTIHGTPAAGTVAPDLTHLASRGTIAAGALPNTPPNVAAWVLDPQAIKPGTNMPANPMSPQEAHDLVLFLRSLL